MTEIINTPEIMDSDWFRDGSIALLREQLAAQTYPGYPTRKDRLKYNLFGNPDSLTLPAGPWEMSGDDMPTSIERIDFSLKDLRTDSYGRPLHPWLEFMLGDPAIGVVTGKGAYWHWGPNYTADPIVLRYDTSEPRVLLIERQDGTGWALPGGFIDKGEGSVEAAVREAGEETGINLSVLKPAATITYRGPLADLRVTAHAWPETTAVRFDIPDTEVNKLPNGMWKGFDDARTAGWFPVSELDTKLFGSHVLLIKQALNQA